MQILYPQLQKQPDKLDFMPAHFHPPSSNLCAGIVFARRQINSNPNLQFSPNQHRGPTGAHLKASEMRFIPGYIIPAMMRGI